MVILGCLFVCFLGITVLNFCLTRFFALYHITLISVSLLSRSPCGNIGRSFGFQCQSCPIPYPAPDPGLSGVLGSGMWYVLTPSPVKVIRALKTMSNG